MAVPQCQNKAQAAAVTAHVEAGVPLFKRAPRTDERGRPLTDFMMIIPQLRTRSARLINNKVSKIQKVLERFGDTVVFADLNLKINVLWVIVRPVPGVCLDIPSAICAEVPEALLVAHPRFC